jgi:late competence protein required for DNA uptake (superfamily II DNA/RNA helicase)
MAFSCSTNKEKFKMHCQRCQGPMAFEKFYGQNTSFYGWHCVLCGEILDPVIFLHWLSRNSNITIPEGEEEILLLINW